MLEMCEKASPNEIYDYRSLSYHKKTSFCPQIHNHRKHLRDSISTEEWEVEKPC